MMPMQNHACKNTKCSHLCLLGPNRAFTCACPEGMELVNDFTCQKSKKIDKIILGFSKYVVAVPHQTFGRHVPSIVQETSSTADIVTYNSRNGQVFIADNSLGRIIAFDFDTKIETVIVDQHVLSVKAMDFGKFLNPFVA
jgi:hypothetical protein